MSLHQSLKGSSKIRVKRNVLKRFERIDALRKLGKWKEGDQVLGLQARCYVTARTVTKSTAKPEKLNHSTQRSFILAGFLTMWLWFYEYPL